MTTTWITRWLMAASLIGAALEMILTPAMAAKGSPRLDELPVERWALLREAERYQLNIAEKFYREQNYKVALAEYEKFLSLYERSEGASYAQLKWSMCQVHLKKLNTAIKDGYQTVIDYWPESPEAVAAALLIGRTYKDMGDLAPAKKAYQAVLAKHADEVVAVLAKVDMAEIARIDMDRSGRITLLKDLTFNSPRTGDAARQCLEASRTLAVLSFEDGAFLDGKNALETSFKEPELSNQIWQYIRAPLTQLAAAAETKDRAAKLADAAIAYYREQSPAKSKDDVQNNRVKQLAYNIADVHQYAGRAADAGQVYTQLLQTFGNDDEILTRYSQWLKTQNRRDDARAAYARMKNEIEGQGNIAWSHREENKHLLAIPIYQQLLTRDAEHAQRWQWQLGEAYREAGKYQEAIAAYQQCENYPTNLQHMAICYRQMQKYKEAQGVYVQILGAYEAAAPNALLQIGYTQEQAGQKEAAITTLQQVCKRFPKSGEASQAHAHLQNKYNISVTLGGAKDE